MIVHANVFNVSESLFKMDRTDRSECQTVDCSLEKCSLRDKGCCVAVGIFSSCPYGDYRREEGFTKASRKNHKWCQDKKEKYKDVPRLRVAPSKLAVIGEYVYLPYAHMDMSDLPWVRRNVYFGSGVPFLKLEFFTIENIVFLLKFRPKALMGGEIKSYQKEEVPKFLVHLQEEMPDKWAELIKTHPEYNRQVNHVGRKAYLNTLLPCEFTLGRSLWKWDGTYLTSYDEKPILVRVESSETKIVPKSDFTVVVGHNDWVGPLTKFEV